MKKRAKKRSKTTQPRPQLDVGELTQVYGSRQLLDEGTKGGGVDHNQI